MSTGLYFSFKFLESFFISSLKTGMTSVLFQSSGKNYSEKHLFTLSWNIFDIISMFSLIILVGILSFWTVFEESRVLIRDSILCFTTPLNEKLDLMILGYCLNFSMIFSKGSWICSTLTNRSSLHCKPSDGIIVAKKLLNFLLQCRYRIQF